jgi:tetratricopeptide (TPR) repeat protein
LYQYAVEQLDKVILKGQGDPDVYSFRGHVLSLRGRYSFALDDFVEGQSSIRQNGRDGEAYAYSLFAVGDCSAIELAQELRHFGDFHPAALVRLYTTEIEMARYCNEPALAHDLQSEMTYVFPRAVKTHLALADLAMDEGDLDLAWRAMANSQMFFQYVGAVDAYARLALIEGRYEDAFQLLQYIKAQRVSDRSMILKGLATILAGDPSVFLVKMNQARWVENENPHLLLLRLWALDELKETSTMQEELRYFQAVCDQQCQQWVVHNLEREMQAELPFRLP